MATADGFVSPRIAPPLQTSGHRLHVKGRWREAASSHVPERAGDPEKWLRGAAGEVSPCPAGSGAGGVPEPRRAARAGAPRALRPPRVPQRRPRAAGRPRGAGGGGRCRQSRPRPRARLSPWWPWAGGAALPAERPLRHPPLPPAPLSLFFFFLIIF